MKISILGGSFDPPHIGHVLVAKQVKEKLNIDEVWLMPCFTHPFNKKINHFSYRYKMTKHLEEDGIKVSDLEIKKGSISYTIDTLNFLSVKYPQHFFYWIISSQDLESFQRWKNWKKIIEKFNLIIFPRNVEIDKLEDEVKKHLKLKTIPRNILVMKSKELMLTNVSSTNIRKRIKSGLPITKLVPKKVEKYIIKNNLYK